LFWKKTAGIQYTGVLQGQSSHQKTQFPSWIVAGHSQCSTTFLALLQFT